MSLIVQLQNIAQCVKEQGAAGHQRHLEPSPAPQPVPAWAALQRDGLTFWPRQPQKSEADISFGT